MNELKRSTGGQVSAVDVLDSDTGRKCKAGTDVRWGGDPFDVLCPEPPATGIQSVRMAGNAAEHLDKDACTLTAFHPAVGFEKRERPLADRPGHPMFAHELRLRRQALTWHQNPGGDVRA
jgi:hypothetical protein